MSTADVRPNTLAIEGGLPVRTTPLPWELPGVHWIDGEELEAMTKVIQSRSLFRYYGPDPQHTVDRFEQNLASYLGRKYALAVNSGTGAIELCLAALDVGPGDEVLIAGYLWVSCVSAIVRSGAIPRLVDIDDTFCMDPADLRAKIGPRSKAILLVHMSGAPGHVREIAEIAKQHKLGLIEDCAQAAGSRSGGQAAGTFGDLATFSFQLNKNMTTGDGGAVVCDDERLYKRCFAMHDLGYARNDAGRLDPSDEDFQMWGMGRRMPDTTGALALVQLSKLERITGAMRRAKWAIRNQLEGIPGLGFRTVVDPDGDSGPFLITIYPTPELCQQFTDALRAEGIAGPPGSLACLTMREWGLHWYYNNASLVHKRGLSSEGYPWTHPANAFAADYSYEKGALAQCDRLCEHAALLTIASCLTDQDIDDIVAAFRKVASVLLKPHA